MLYSAAISCFFGWWQNGCYLLCQTNQPDLKKFGNGQWLVFPPFACGPDHGWIQWGCIATLKTYESNFIHHDFIQSCKKHSRYNVILLPIVLSQQFCEVYFISLTIANPRMRLHDEILLKSHPLNLLAGSSTGPDASC